MTVININLDREKIIARYSKAVRVIRRRRKPAADGSYTYRTRFECPMLGHGHQDMLSACVCQLKRDPAVEQLASYNLFLVKEEA